jgi:hypothetical protein
MSKKSLSVLLSISMLTNLVSPIGLYAADTTYFYRYKTDMGTSAVPPEGQSKDIVAYYVGGIGVAFDERLPLKPEWEDDGWVVVKGSLPNGIAFDPATRRFTGTPTAAGTKQVVELEGFDKTGASVATASATFDIYAIQGDPYRVDLYAHTGKYKLDQLPLPAKTIEDWTRVYSPPAGIEIIGRNLDGTPTKAGVYPVFLQGKDYLGNVVATYFGKYTVEDGPSFPSIPDSIQKLPQMELGWSLGPFNFGAPTPYGVNYAINPKKAPRYFIETKEGDDLPYGIRIDDNVADTRFIGFISRPYDTVTARFRVIDSDDTVGYSNWFTFGSGDPQPGCYPYPVGVLTTYTGQAAAISIPRPFGSQGELHYSLVSGTLPQGLKLEELTGALTGTPIKAEAPRAVTVEIAVVNEGGTTKTSCAYSIESRNGSLSLVDSTAAQARQIRVGDTYTGRATVNGGIADWSTAFTEGKDHLGLAISGDTRNATSVEVSGPVASKGLPHLVSLTVSNGDGNSTDGQIAIYAREALAAGVVADFPAKRMDATKTLAAVPYDSETVVPDVSGATDYPVITIDHPERLPQGVGFDGRYFVGATADAVGTYGPFKATIRDFTGQTATTNEFSLSVTERDGIAVAGLVAPTFTIARSVKQSATPVTVKQPAGAAALAIEWAIAGTLPGWLSFDKDTGALSADPGLAFSDIGSYGPFTVTATDSDGSSITSDPFDVSVADIAQPAARPVPQVNGNVSGDTASGEDATFVSTAALRDYIRTDTILGDLKDVEFLSSEPESPAGLSFSKADGVFSGVPTSEFDGNIVVDFKDAEGRAGTVSVPLTVKPYPKVSMTAAEYELVRHADAAPISASTSEGFWGAPTWRKAKGDLPGGVSLNAQSGALGGSTSVAAGTVFTDIVFAARDAATNLNAFTRPFTITVKEKGDFTVSYGTVDTFYLIDRTENTDYAVSSHALVAPTVVGSAVSPLAYSIASADPQLPPGLGINPATGVAVFTGVPVLGKWDIEVSATDAEGEAAKQPVALKVWSTLAGTIVPPVGEAAPGTGEANGLGSGSKYVLRVGEPFSTKVVKATNYVGDITFETAPAVLYDGLDFVATTGAFTDESHFTAAGNYAVSIGATDSDGRQMPPIGFAFQVVKPLELPLSKTLFQAKQYANSALSASFEPAKNALGKVSYAISGDAPGTVVYQQRDENDVLTGYAWKADDLKAYEVDVATDGKVTGYRIDGVPKSLVGDVADDYLPVDALVFNPAALTLNGTPSKTGVFPLKLVATDDHMSRYLKNVASRVANNTAEAAFTVVSEAADPLAIATTTKDGSSSADAINQYTSKTTLVTTVTYAAYGKPVTWTATAGTLPSGIVPVKGASTLSYDGYAEATGTYGDIRWTAKDAAGRTIESSAATIAVGPRLALALKPTSNPKGMIVNTTDADLTVTSENTAYGQAIAASKWTVSGTLPPGVTYAIAGGSVHFSGVATQIGEWKNIVVTGVDAKNASASVSLTFKVITPTDEIVLTVPSLTTKAGHPFTIQATASNTYGGVRFYSNDIETVYATQLDIASATGLIGGMFTTTQQANFDVYVTDETNRVTSRPVIVDVIPDLRIVVPTLVTVEQGELAAQKVDTFNTIGTVSYEPVGNWPDGLTVNAQSGSIEGTVTAAIGTYPDLRIKGTDRFAVAQEDGQVSNAFSIKVDPINALPTIDPVAANKWTVGTVGSVFPTFAPVVRDNVKNKPWPGPLTFKANHDIAADTGLTFDPKTGTISGIATKPIIYTDLVITATTERGDKASITPFWFGVQPKDPIVIAQGQKSHYGVRVGSGYSTDPLVFLNTYGVVKFTNVQALVKPIGPTNGVYSETTVTTGSLSSQPAGGWPEDAVVTDEFGRTGTFRTYLEVVPELKITAPSVLTVDIEATATSGIPAIVGVLGTKSLASSGMPSWVKLNADGTVTATPPAGTPTGPVIFTVTVTDSYDNTSKSATYTVTVRNIKAYRVVFDTWQPHPSLPICVGLSEFRVFNGTSDITSISGVTVSDSDPSYPAVNLTDGVVSTSSMWFITSTVEKWIKWVPVRGKLPTSINWTHRADNFIPCNPTSWHIQTTDDNQTWTTLQNGSGPGGGGATVTTILQ